MPHQPGRGNVTLADARTITVQPWEKKMIPVIEKAIRDSDLGLNPATVRRCHPGADAGAHRGTAQELIKVVRHEAEDARIAVRNIRRDANDHLKKLLKDNAVAEDDERHAQTDVQKLTDRYHRRDRQGPRGQGNRPDGDLTRRRRTRPPLFHRLPVAHVSEFHPRYPRVLRRAAPRGDHHGRQRALGEAARAAPRRRPPPGRGDGA